MHNELAQEISSDKQYRAYIKNCIKDMLGLPFSSAPGVYLTAECVDVIANFQAPHWCKTRLGIPELWHSTRDFIFVNGNRIVSEKYGYERILESEIAKKLKHHAEQLPGRYAKTPLEVVRDINNDGYAFIRVSDVLDDVNSIGENGTGQLSTQIIGWSKNTRRMLALSDDLECRIIPDPKTNTPLAAVLVCRISEQVLAIITNPSQVYTIASQVLEANNYSEWTNKHCDLLDRGLIDREYRPTKIAGVNFDYGIVTLYMRLSQRDTKHEKSEIMSLVGTFFCSKERQDYVSHLENRDIVYAIYDPMNKHDINAIRITSDSSISQREKNHIGWIAKHQTHVMTPLVNKFFAGSKLSDVFNGRVAVPLCVKRLKTGYTSGCVGLYFDSIVVNNRL